MKTLATVALWSGRSLAVCAFLLWGAFFVEHLGEFLRPGQGPPPPAQVWLLQAAHGAMLLGLLMLLRWEIPGGLLTIAAALVFFANVAGRNFPLFFGLTILPAALVLLGRLLEHRAAAPPPAHPLAL
jgi:hypothetical protein